MLGDLAGDLRTLLREKRIYGESATDQTIGKHAWKAVYREFLTDEPRLSLAGVSLAAWTMAWPAWLQIPEVLLNPPWSLNEREAKDVLLVLLDSMRADRGVELILQEGTNLSWDELEISAYQLSFRIGPGNTRSRQRSWDGVDNHGNNRRWKRTDYLMRVLGGVPDDKAVRTAVDALRKIWDSIEDCDRQVDACDKIFVPHQDARRLNPNWWRVRFVEEQQTVYQCDTCARIQSVSVRNICARRGCSGTLQAVARVNLRKNHYRNLYETSLPSTPLRAEEHTAQLAPDKAREFQNDFGAGRIHVLSSSTTFEVGVDLGDLDTVFLRNVPPEPFNYIQRVGRAGRRAGHTGLAITYCRRMPHDLYHFTDPDRMIAGKTKPPILRIANEKILIRHMAAVALSAWFRACPDRFGNVKKLFGDLEAPQARSDFERFIQNQRATIEASLRLVVPRELHPGMGLQDGTWIARISDSKSGIATAELQATSDFKVVKSIEEEMRDLRHYHEADWARKRAQTMENEDVLSFLSRKVVIPKYGFPVDVVELDTQQSDQAANSVTLQRDLSMAISEFAPTSRLVANKREWESYGLKRVPEREWERKHYKRCVKHNVFVCWNHGAPASELPCRCNESKFTYIIPSFGFTTRRTDKPEEPKRRAAKVFTTRPYFIGTTGAQERIKIPENHPQVEVGKASPGQMAVLCEGRKGNGFWICDHCGAGAIKRTRNGEEHDSPYGKKCRGAMSCVSLGHEFATDVLTLHFIPNPPANLEPLSFAFSLAYSILEGAAEALDVPASDLNITVAQHVGDRIPPIVLYDNVPGGAGLVAQLEQQNILYECLKIAHKRVSGGCGCGEQTSCYACLRSYRNQFMHDKLQRGPVQSYLEAILDLEHGWA
jgi:hypothetical protein